MTMAWKRMTGMSQPTVHESVKKVASAQASLDWRATFAERRFRRISIWIMLYLLLQAELGLGWDRRWHDYLGRDQFWIPPHILIYSGVGAAGVIALLVVLIETVRYWRRVPGVDDSSTVSILHYFHAPLGFILLGFGALTDLIAAPFDNYWHELYGIDVTLWAPFHLMGTFGGLMAGIGVVYAVAAEINYDRRSGRPLRRWLGLSGMEWTCLILFTGIVEISLPALTAFAALPLGSLQLITYPLVLALAGGLCLVSAVQVTRKPGAATLTALMICMLSLFTQSFVITGLWWAVDNLGMIFRPSAGAPVLNVTIVLVPWLFVIAGLLIDVIAYRQRRRDAKDFEQNGLHNIWLIALCVALPAWLGPSTIVALLMHLVPALPLPTDVTTVLTPSVQALFLVAPLVLLMSLGATWLGTAFGDIWYWQER
jgi:hypothetical protein